MSHRTPVIRGKNTRVSRMCNSCPQNLRGKIKLSGTSQLAVLLRVELDSLSKPSKRKPDLAEKELLSHIMGNSLFQPLLPKDPVSICGSSPVLWAIPPSLCDPNGIIVLQLHADLQFLLFVPHAACSNVQVLQRHAVIQLGWTPFYPVMKILRSLLPILHIPFASQCIPQLPHLTGLPSFPLLPTRAPHNDAVWKSRQDWNF